MAPRRKARTRVSRDAMGQISNEYLTCRDRAIGHDWDVDVSFSLTPRITGGYDLTRSCRCVRCTATRVEYFDHVGRDGYITKVKQRYVYPEGYQVTGIGEITSADVYTEQFRRADVKMPAKRKTASAKTVRKRAAKAVS